MKLINAKKIAVKRNGVSTEKEVDKKYKVKIRRGEGFEVKPEAEQLDGNMFLMREMWEISDQESSIYAGEFAMSPANGEKNWPENAPIWIASGDLIEIL